LPDRSQPIARVPRIPPNENDIEDFEVFRETFLARIHDPAHNDACRSFAKFFFSLVRAEPGYWPLTWADHDAHMLQAALADLRFLQGNFAYLGSPNGAEDERREALQRLASRFSRKVGKLADELEHELGAWGVPKG
jgi:hypothetical protein